MAKEISTRLTLVVLLVKVVAIDSFMPRIPIWRAKVLIDVNRSLENLFCPRQVSLFDGKVQQYCSLSRITLLHTLVYWEIILLRFDEWKEASRWQTCSARENENGSFVDAKTKNMILDVCMHSIHSLIECLTEWRKISFSLFLQRRKHKHSIALLFDPTAETVAFIKRQILPQ